MLSIIIPSYKDPYLQKTIEGLLEEAHDSVEIVVVLDGYHTEIHPDLLKIPQHEIKVIELGTNVGMREAINIGVKASKGEYIMRVDEHQMFGDAYDKILKRDCGDNEIMTPRRYFLDPVQWKVMDIEPIDTMELRIAGGKFTGVDWKRKNDTPIEESMAMQGSCWVMKRKWWDDVIGELQTEGYGPLIQDSHEMVFKTWKAGGRLVCNKNTWHSHKHRDFPRTHNNGTEENPANQEAGYAYAIEQWGDYFEKDIKPKWNLR